MTTSIKQLSEMTTQELLQLKNKIETTLQIRNKKLKIDNIMKKIVSK